MVIEPFHTWAIFSCTNCLAIGLANTATEFFSTCFEGTWLHFILLTILRHPLYTMSDPVTFCWPCLVVLTRLSFHVERKGCSSRFTPQSFLELNSKSHYDTVARRNSEGTRRTPILGIMIIHGSRLGWIRIRFGRRHLPFCFSSLQATWDYQPGLFACFTRGILSYLVCSGFDILYGSQTNVPSFGDNVVYFASFLREKVWTQFGTELNG